MGVLSDRLRDVIEQMKESDERLQKLTDEFLTSTSKLLEDHKTLIEKSIED